MKQITVCGCADGGAKKMTATPAETLLQASFAAQAQLPRGRDGAMFPAVAESPIPVLAPRNRTPDPLRRAAMALAAIAP